MKKHEDGCGGGRKRARRIEATVDMTRQATSKLDELIKLHGQPLTLSLIWMIYVFVWIGTASLFVRKVRHFGIPLWYSSLVASR
jgi:hypothetical protein